jgi:hypothetical protein
MFCCCKTVRIRASTLAALLVVCFTANPSGAASSSVQSAQTQYEKRVQPLLARYCYGCHNQEKHKGELSLAALANGRDALQHPEIWEKVLSKLRDREMPPEEKPQPSSAERERVAGWIEHTLFDCENPDPGRVTLRRLNRAEYNNTIRDLVGVDFHPADDFPADDTGYGFDNIGDVLTLSPMLLEKYLAAAETILNSAFTNDAIRGGIFVCDPQTGNTNQCFRAILGRFAQRAYRRPVQADEIERLIQLAEMTMANGADFQTSVKTALEAVLISPRFLFRGELPSQAAAQQKPHTIDEYALASRLSYFLWSSMPDEELFGLASKNQLRRHLDEQVRRMLRDPKSKALVENFSGQWLQTRNLKQVTPDAKLFPAFDDELRDDMARETELFFENVAREDRSILDFLDGDYTFVNERLARLYGLKGVSGPEFRRVSLKGTARGGVLTQGSVLTVTSNPTRTSPVKRGKWVLENLLAQPPPPPPPGVPPLAEGADDTALASLRQRMERHRSDPHCASCHEQMDPLGFSLENFDAIGAWREQDGSFPIDAAGQLPSGEHFSGAPQLRQMLMKEKRSQFVRCLTEKMLTYALGRGLEYYDRCAVERITSALPGQGYRFSALVLGIVKSVPFEQQRGDNVDGGQHTDAEAGARAQGS